MRILGDSWYAEALGADVLAAPANTVLRGLTFFIRSRRYDRVLTSGGTEGAKTLALCLGLAGQRKLFLLEFMPGAELRGKTLLGRARTRFARAIWSYSLSRSAVRIHVLTQWEADAYSSMLRIDPGRFACVPWPLADMPPNSRWSPYVGERRGVVASGRASCDWETFFAAAHGQSWDVTAICGIADLERVRALAEDATVLCDIPVKDHFLAISRAAVYALPLQENGISAGHIRLMTAIAAHTPVVASDVHGLDGYIEGIAQPVPPGDPMALRRAIQRLLDAPRAARDLADSASAAVVNRTASQYLAQLQRLLD